jgi:phage FluMu protein Com
LKVAARKVYCSHCQKLVKGEAQKTESTVRVICPQCKKPVYVKEGFFWRYIKEED